MALEEGRVIEIWSPAQGQVGTGYLLDGAHVLTARHLLGDGDGECEARPLGEEEWRRCTVRWRGRGDECDAALLRIDDADPDARPAVRLGRLVTGERAPCRAVGFPEAQRRAEASLVRDTEELVGELAPLTGRKSGLLTLDAAAGVARPRDAEGTAWRGMSGAAVLAAPRADHRDWALVGVIGWDARYVDSRRLLVVPVPMMLDEPEFREALAGWRGAVMPPAVEALGVLRDPYLPLPPAALREGATAFLLQAEYGTVSFRGREREREELREWCSGDPELSVRLCVGAGGTGKTRIAAEVCRDQRDAGAVAGFLERGADVGALERLALARAPLLVAVDEAQARTGELVDLLGVLAHAARDKPTRVLLVARQRGDWWDSGLQERLADDGAARLAVATARVTELGPVETTVEGRADAFADAARAFGAATRRPVADAAPPDLGKPVFDAMLFVHLAAMTALEGEDGVAGRRDVADDLLGFALGREARYWADTARARELAASPRVLERAVAAATLATAADEAQAAAALKAVPDLADASERERREIAHWLRELYASPDEGAAWLQPLAPDPLGEALIARVLATGAAPSLATDLLRAAAPEQARRALTVLTHAAHDHADAERALRDALAAHLESLWPVALEVAQQAGDPIGTMLAETLEAQPRPELALEIVGGLPRHTTALRELAAVAATQALNHAMAQEDPDSLLQVAGLSVELSARLALLGRFHDALEVSERAVRGLREMDRQWPGTFEPGLAAALDDQGVILSELGRRDDAMAATGEALELRRGLVAADADAHGPALATSLLNLSNRLREQGRPEEALAAIDEAVALFRRPTAAIDRDTRLASLAMALNNRGLILNVLGRREEALTSTEEAAGHYRVLADARPDAFLPDLASALTTLATAQRLLGRRQALGVVEQAVKIHRDLAEKRPDAFLSPLASSLFTLTAHLDAVGRSEEAVEPLAEAIRIWDRLADLREDAPLPALAGALSYACTLLRQLGQAGRSVEAGEEAVDIHRSLAAERPDAHEPDLAAALASLSVALGVIERHDEALEAAAEAVEIYRRLAAARPDAFEDSLALALDGLTIAYGNLGRPEAIETSREAERLWRGLAAGRPEAHADSLAQSLVVLFAALAEQERWDEALPPVREAVALLDELAAAHPLRHLTLLGHALAGMAKALMAIEAGDEAADALERSAACYRRLAAERSPAFRGPLLAVLDARVELLEELGRSADAAAPRAEAAALRAEQEQQPATPAPRDAAPSQAEVRVETLIPAVARGPVSIAATNSTTAREATADGDAAASPAGAGQDATAERAARRDRMRARRGTMRRRLSFPEHVRQLCRARYPFLYVRTWEEERVLGELQRLAGTLTPERQVLTWGRVGGLAPDGQQAMPDTDDPLRALAAIESYSEPALFVLKDFHVVLRNRGREETEQVIRKMRDLASASKRNPPKVVVIVAPSVVLPEELQKDVTVLDFDLPGHDEIRGTLERLMERNRRGGRITIELDEDAQERLVEAALGLTLREVEHAFARAMVDDDRLDATDVEVVLEEKRQIIARTEILEFIPTEDDFDDIGGLESLKKWLLKRNGSWLEAARDYGLKPPKGLLITGVPGCGKSLTAKCTSAVWGLPLLRLDVGRIFSSLLGDSEERMRTALRTAEAIAPSILFIDEIEKAFGDATGPSLDGGTSSRVFGSFLTWMQEKEHPVFVIATANNLDRLPPEFLRKGRFDEIFFVDLPTHAERARIIEIHLDRRLQDPRVAGDFEVCEAVVDQLTALTAGFSGAELEQVVTTALFDAFSERRSIELDDLLRAIGNTVPLSTTQAEKIEAQRVWAADRAVSATAPDHRPAPVATAGAAGDSRGGRDIQF